MRGMPHQTASEPAAHKSTNNRWLHNTETNMAIRKLAEEDRKKIENLTREYLVKGHGDDIKFGDIIVKHSVNHEDQDFAHISIIIDGDISALNSSWTLGLAVHLWPYTDEIGFDLPAGKTFITEKELKENPNYLNKTWHTE